MKNPKIKYWFHPHIQCAFPIIVLVFNLQHLHGQETSGKNPKDTNSIQNMNESQFRIQLGINHDDIDLKDTTSLNIILGDATETDIDMNIPEINEIRKTGVFSIQVDQDFLFFSPSTLNEDRNYTQGTVFNYSHPELIRSVFFFPLRIIEKYHRSYRLMSASFSLGATAFTPRIIDSINPVVGDRPFAFLFFVSTSSTFVRPKSVAGLINKTIRNINIFNTYSINYGAFGSNLGYEFQSFAHKYIVTGRPTDPKGWDHQISKGGSPALLFEYNRFRPLTRIPICKNNIEPRSLFDLGWNFGGSVGYYDRVFSGLYSRIGYLRDNNQARWNGGWSSLNSASFQKITANQYESTKIDTLKALEIPILKEKSPFSRFCISVPEIFIYGRFSGTFMLRNAMLVGQRFRNSEYTLNPEWVKTGLLEYEWGAVVSFESAKSKSAESHIWAIQYRQIYRSPEFDSGLFPARWHYFGSLGILLPVR